MVSKMGFIKFSNLLLCEQNTPSITPKKTHIKTERPIKPKVCREGSHIPVAPQKYITNPEYKPNLKPPAIKQGKISIVAINSQGESSKKS